MLYLKRNTIASLLLLFLMLSATHAGAQEKKVRGGLKKAEEWYILGDSLYDQGLYDSAASCFEVAGKIYEKKEKWAEAANSYYQGGNCYYKVIKLNNSESLNKKALQIIYLNKLHETCRGRIMLFDNILLASKIYLMHEDYKKSQDYLKIGIKYFDTTFNCDEHESYVKVNILKLSGLIYSKLGDYKKSFFLLNQAIDLTKKISGNNSGFLAEIYSHLGSISLYRDDFENADLFLSLANNIYLQIFGVNSIDYASNLLIYSALNKELGKLDRAKSNLLEAKEIFLRKYGENDIRIAAIYNNLASLYISDSINETSLDYYLKARNIYENQIMSKKSLVAFIDNNIGLMYYNRQKYKDAIGYFISAIDTRKSIYGRKHFRVAQSYYYLGCNYSKMLEFNKALVTFQEALLSLCPDFNDTCIFSNPFIKHEYKLIDLFNILSEKAYASYRFSFASPDSLQYLELSIKTYELALSVLDVIRTEYCSQESKILFTGENKQKLLRATLILDELQKTPIDSILEKYLVLSEKLKSFVLYSSIKEDEITNRAGIPDSLRKIEADLKSDIKLLRTEIQKYKYLDTTSDSSIILQDEALLLSKIQRYDSLTNYFKLTYPRYYELKYNIHTPGIPDVKKSLSDNEAILNYMISDSLLYILVITNEIYSVIKKRIGNNFEEEIINYCRQIKKAEDEIPLSLSAIELFNKLIAPAEDIIANKQRLIIIPDEYLGYLPFETLIKNSEINISDDVRRYEHAYLINIYDIVYNYSVSLWWNSRNTSISSDSSIDRNTFIGFAPVFDEKEQIDYSNEGFIDSLKYALVERSFIVNDNFIQELPYSMEEVGEIYKLFTSNSSNSKMLLSAGATKKNFINNISDYTYIHVATHGFSNDKYPELSGLVFYPEDDTTNYADSSVNQRRKYFDRNVLFSGEMFNLDINADLLVLSACETGVGKLERGEGIMSMTRGLLYSGARNIVFSLWKVNDKPTKELMIEFYKKILDGNDYSSALRKAKMKMINSSITPIPKLWSGFLLVGD